MKNVSFTNSKKWNSYSAHSLSWLYREEEKMNDRFYSCSCDEEIFSKSKYRFPLIDGREKKEFEDCMTGWKWSLILLFSSTYIWAKNSRRVCHFHYEKMINICISRWLGIWSSTRRNSSKEIDCSTNENSCWTFFFYIRLNLS